MNCKPGDMAVIVKPRVNDVNVGKLVFVKEFIGTFRCGERFTWNGQILLADPAGSYWWVEGAGLQNDSGWHSAAHIDDSRLRPITPPPGCVTDSEVTELFSPAPKQRETTHG